MDRWDRRNVTWWDISYQQCCTCVEAKWTSSTTEIILRRHQDIHTIKHSNAREHTTRELLGRKWRGGVRIVSLLSWSIAHLWDNIGRCFTQHQNRRQLETALLQEVQKFPISVNSEDCFLHMATLHDVCGYQRSAYRYWLWTFITCLATITHGVHNNSTLHWKLFGFSNNFREYHKCTCYIFVPAMDFFFVSVSLVLSFTFNLYWREY